MQRRTACPDANSHLALTLTSFDPGMLIFCDPPTFRAQAGRPSASWRQPGPRLPPRDRWRRPFARANGGSANLSTPGSIPKSVEALFDPFKEVIGICTVLGPIENRLIVLIDTGIVGAEADANALERGVKASSGKGIPRPLEHLDPFIIILGEGELVLDLRVQLGGAAVASNSIDNNIVERIAKCRALASHARDELARQPAHGGLKQNGGETARGYSRFKMRSAATCCCVRACHFAS
jgi:hypothetical protein